MSELQPRPQPTKPSKQEGRRLFLRGGAVAGGILLASKVGIDLTPTQANASPLADRQVFKASREVRPFKYFPNAKGLADPLYQFAQFHSQRTGEPVNIVWGRIKTGILDQFVGMYGIDPAWGMCNGAAQLIAIEQGNINDYLDAVGTVYHYDDKANAGFFNGKQFGSVSELGSPIHVDLMVSNKLGAEGLPLVGNFSLRADQLWCRPIDEVTRTVTKIGSGLSRVNLRMRTGNYVEHGGGYEYKEVTYVIEEGNVHYPGQFESPSIELWLPDFNLNGALARIDNPIYDQKEEGRLWAKYRVKGTILTKPMIKSYFIQKGYLAS